MNIVRLAGEFGQPEANGVAGKQARAARVGGFAAAT